MSDLERAKLIPVSGNSDTPDMNNAVDVQFNPMTLKVSLANTLKANQNNSSSRATQFVDKSSSTLTVELVFDTTYIESPAAGGASGDGSQQSSSGEQIEQGSDVRLQTRKIADKFIKPVESGGKMQAPSRVLFQWGSFEFIGMVQSYDETLDFFSPKGRPLRATVALKLSEDRYQFRSNDSDALAAEQTPELAFNGSGTPSQETAPVPGGSDGPGSWRDNAMFNGIESPRLPLTASLALPSVSLGAGAGFGISGGVGIGLSAGASIGGGISAGLSASLNSSVAGAAGSSTTTGGGVKSAATQVAPAFKYGNSTALGTGVPGAFHAHPQTSLKASGLQAGSVQLRTPATTVSASGSNVPATGQTAVRSAGSAATTGSDRSRHGVSVAALLKRGSDSGVGFD
ncbi:MAG: hypothetical protein KDI49_10280 [Gammaproteobacteria bacterium]|nr:hypothetical protein [Gammaproteobacteria bacterium]